jgi:hypothetical protein
MNAIVMGLARCFFGVVVLAAAAACADWPASVPMSPAGTEPRTATNPDSALAGDSVFGTSSYIVYYPGNSPVIFAAPHGGNVAAPDILLRTTASTSCNTDDIVTLADLYTREMAMEIRTAFHARTGRYPHVIINRVHRARMDPNRDSIAGACQDPEGVTAWNEYHAFIRAAMARVTADHGRGWFTDLHGHAHDIQRLELGYMLAGSALLQSNAKLDSYPVYENASTLRTFSQGTTAKFSRVLRGPASLGTLLAAAGHRSVPSVPEPDPGGNPYFNGGYSVGLYTCSTHTLSTSTAICGVQIEHDASVKVPTSARLNYVNNLLSVYDVFLAQNFGFNMASGLTDIIVDDDNANNDTARARFSASTSWTRDTANAQTHLNTFHWAPGAAAAEDSAVFAFNIATGGTYVIQVRWPTLGNSSGGVYYRVFPPAGSQPSNYAGYHDQGDSGGAWNPLGVHTFSSGWGRVVIYRSPSWSGTIAADAIRVTREF